jgi:putative endonuclease
MNWIVYLLVSRSLKFYNYSYVGITTDLDRRLKQHNGLLAGGAKYTSARRPFELAYSIDNIKNRSDATKLELNIKKFKGYENRLNFMKNYEINL